MSSKSEVDNSWYAREELPPVGCECEFCSSYDEWTDWRRAVFVGFDSTGNGVVSVFGDAKALLWISSNPDDFRPLRTERENAIDDISSYFCDADGFQVTPHATDLIAARIYDAGYRKAKS